ncbi:tRNA (N6-threonylcarbamoyladenosine(37)-N6)-methyltransferase TrmO [Dehalogenimonas sp. THU2]|uniref:tRNA (N6-threonylcarbamoyladenosine(37)-N6)-methyltransferase TrmO n=1 Tax=Dehalogenimonas sp. THU2 TaxID=3151121 RepID=UPI003218D0E3
MTELTMELRPIGRIKSPVTEKPADGFDWREVVAEIEIDPALAEGLDGLTDFSHIMVYWWMHRATDKAKMALKVFPRGRKDLPPVGVFASRSPYRPNSLGRATVRLLERRDNVLVVQGLDAIDGTPVLDIKPFIPGYDSPEGGATAPEWTTRHQRKN